MDSNNDELKQIENNIRILSIKMGITSILLLCIILYTACYIQKELNKVIKVDIPEELEFTISKDSTTCDTLLAFKKNNTIYIRYKSR
jgi:hypothetical protein